MKNKYKTIKALKIIINNNHIMSPKDFGREYFKNQDILTKRSNIGNGATQGVGAWFSAGRILKSLKQDGLITYDDFERKYNITRKGMGYINNNK
jgi:hypothetical protein